MFTKTEYLYVLECKQGKWYVGTSYDPIKRFEDHVAGFGKGAEWTKLYEPVRLVQPFSPVKSLHDENNKTVDLMKDYGIDNVRGGQYSRTVLSVAERTVLSSTLRSHDNRCYSCGEKGHFANTCPLPKNRERRKPYTRTRARCHRCGRKGHLQVSCFARKDANGKAIG